jgi:DNA-binding HxlR family transcriptional regulator
MTTPMPRKRVRGSATGRPIMALLDLLGRRMTLRILWELRAEALTFRALEAAAETNPSVLNTRLRELREAHLVEHGPEGYALTRHGRALLERFLPLNTWADDWARLLDAKGGKAKRK